MEQYQCHGKCSVLEAECVDDDEALAHVMVQSLCKELSVAPCKCLDITHCDGSCANRRYVEREISESGELIADLIEALQEARTQIALLQSMRGIVDTGCGTLSIIDAALAKAGVKVEMEDASS
jgi:hypothetical protein